MNANARRTIKRVLAIFKENELELHTSEIVKRQSETLKLFYRQGVTKPQLAVALMELHRIGQLLIEYDENSRISVKAVNQPVDAASRRHVHLVRMDDMPSGTFVLNPDPPKLLASPKPPKRLKRKLEGSTKPLQLGDPHAEERLLQRATELIVSLSARVETLEQDNRRLRMTPSLQYVDVATDWPRFLHEALTKLRGKATRAKDSTWASLSSIDVAVVQGSMANVTEADAKRLVEKLERAGVLKVCPSPNTCCHVLMEPDELTPQALKRAGVELGEIDELRAQLSTKRAQHTRLERQVAELIAQREALQAQLDMLSIRPLTVGGLSPGLRREIEEVLRRASF